MPVVEPKRLGITSLSLLGDMNQRRMLRLLGWTPSAPLPGCDAFLGWGRRKTSYRAELLAQMTGKPLLRIEDGFLRSLDLGVRGSPSFSYVLDNTGIYFDATAPSDLETLLQEGGWESSELLERAKAGIELLRRERLSKYNAAPEPEENDLPPPGYVLVIDQTQGDASVRYGNAGIQDFKHMLAAARREHPEREILVKTHPDVAANRKCGYLSGERHIRILAKDINPWAVIEAASHVYTVTSQMGFEALLAGKSVTTFGAPFYAGWGLTDDRGEIPERRTTRRSLQDLFAAAYILYPIYYDPRTNQLSNFETIAELLIALKRRNNNNLTQSVCLGISP